MISRDNEKRTFRESMRLRIPSLSIHRFRSLSDLLIPEFGRVNLITGRNNSGKSSVLEAIRLLATEGDSSTIYSILDYREETESESEEGPLTAEETIEFCNLFTGFPPLSKCTDPILISSEPSVPSPKGLRLSMRINWFTEEVTKEGSRAIRPVQEQLFAELGGFPALEIETRSAKRLLRLGSDLRRRFPRRETNERSGFACVFVDPFSSRNTAQLGSLWDTIALTAPEMEVVNALRIIAPDIEAVSMVGGDGGRRPRTAIVKSRLYSHPLHLRSLGDGINRLFGIILSLVNAKDGLLLVDEIENGMHHSILVQVWTVILKIAKSLNVQVFATSHSWDCIEAFQAATSKDPEEGILVRLTVKEGAIIPTVFKEGDLAVVTRDKIEVR